jgi:hypothetical protein
LSINLILAGEVIDKNSLKASPHYGSRCMVFGAGI